MLRTCMKSCILVLVLLGGVTASAATSDRVSFRIGGLVIVWVGDTATGAGIAPAFAVPAGEVASVSLPFRHGGGELELLTGFLPIDPGDAAGATRFHVASNTAFFVDAELSDASPETLGVYGPVSFALSVSANGPAAQLPHTDGPAGGLTGEARTLGDLAARSTVFRGNRQTARSRGTITEQSVQFDVLVGGHGDPVAGPFPDIVFSVYVP